MSGKEVTLIIDGREVSATEGEMLHDAAKRGDVEIPVFCYEPKLGEPVGACRMCLVEIEGIPKLQTSCSTPVRDGMVVHTRTEQVKHAQSAVVEFLLVNHPLDCPVCDKGGECPLQDISMGWGPGKSRMIDDKRHFEKPIELSPLVAIDRERCILCYRCVRFSQEVAEDEQLQLLERGDRTFVGTFDDRPYIAPFHGNITDLCPVGALTSYTYRFRARPWDIEQAGSVCTLCPSQCNVSFTVRDEQVKRVISRDNPDVDDGWLCDRGRYGFEMFAAEERVSAPRLRAGEASWGDAIAAAAAGLRRASDFDPPEGGSTSDAPGRVAAIVGDASNEEGYLVQRIVREALGSPHVDSRVSRGPGRDLQARIAQPELTAAVRDIDDADLILVLGTDPLHSSPILDLRIRKAMRRNGAKLALATERPTPLDGGAEAVARYAPGEAGHFIAELTKALTDVDPPPSLGDRPATALPSESGSGADSAKRSEGESTSVAEALREAERVVVIWGERIAREQGTTEALLDVAAALNLASTEGAGLLEVPDLANARGLREVGCLPDAGPGLTETAAGKSTEEIREGLISGEIKSLILFGVDPLRDFPDTDAWKSALAVRRPHRHLLDLRDGDDRDLRRRLPARDPRRERRHRHPPRRPAAAGAAVGRAAGRHPPQLGRPRRVGSGTGSGHRHRLPALRIRRTLRGGADLLGPDRRRDRRQGHPLAGPPCGLSSSSGRGHVRGGGRPGPTRRTRCRAECPASRTRPTSPARTAHSSSVPTGTCGRER